MIFYMEIEESGSFVVRQYCATDAGIFLKQLQSIIQKYNSK